MASKKKIKAILFDWAGVFCMPGELFAYPKLLATLNMELPQVEKQIEDIREDYYRGIISSSVFWNRSLQRLEVRSITPAELSRAYLRSTKLYPGMLPFAKRLKSKYQVGLVSNMTEEMMRHILIKYNLKDCFDKMIFSNRIGHIKPELPIFKLALKRLGVTAEETIFIDDSPTNIKAAARLGMHTVLALSPKQVRNDVGEILKQNK